MEVVEDASEYHKIIGIYIPFESVLSNQKLVDEIVELVLVLREEIMKKLPKEVFVR